MRGVANIGKNAQDVRKSVLLQPYSKVILNVDDDRYFEAGNDSGLTLEVECPWGTQEMANDILSKVRGYQYQPYSVTGAIIDPSVEMGDSIQANGVYGGLYQQDATFGHTYFSDLSAPQDEQLDHEYTYKSPAERKIIRQKAWTKAELQVLDDAIRLEVKERGEEAEEFRAQFETQSREISAKVSQSGGDNSSFGWSLLATEFGLYSGSRKIFTCNADGVEVNGVIKARSGRIGCNADGNGGFEITSNAIRNGKTSYNENANNGVYIGTTGIGLGKGTFYVDQNGNMVAKNADITGNITATSGSFSGKLEGATGTFKGDISAASGKFTGTVYASKLVFTTPTGATYTISGANISDNTIGDGKISGLSGTKVGTGINGGNINSGSVGSSQIGDSAVTSPKIKSGAVTRPKGDSNVQKSLDNGDTAKASYDSLVAGSVTASYLRANSLYGGNLFVKYNSSTWYSVSWRNITVDGKSYYVLAH